MPPSSVDDDAREQHSCRFDGQARDSDDVVKISCGKTIVMAIGANSSRTSPALCG